MRPWAGDGGIVLYHGDALRVLAEIPDATVDLVCTDPPYGLEFMGEEWDSFGQSIEPFRSNDGYERAAQPQWRGARAGAPGAFGAWCEQWAAECLRVLKPGGHLLAFGGTRTWHRLTCAIEDAGFEIRDSIAWLYGNGFPKSLDVSKAIDKAQRRDYVLAAIDLGLTIPGNNLHDWTKADHSPGDKWWNEFRRVLPGEDWARLERAVVARGTAGLGKGADGPAHGGGFKVSYDVTAPATDVAAGWQGWGTALKPAHEPIVVARKPLAGTVAANVLAHGTGALNVDGCRVGTDGGCAGAGPGPQGAVYGDGLNGSFAAPVPGLGRWPANVVLDEEQAAELDRQSGTLTSGKIAPHHADNGKSEGTLGAFAGAPGRESYGDSGGASRFFPTFRYHPKADRDERPFVDGVAHPTVKPLALMRWLIRLGCPPGGVVLDPFAGSGTTLEAARLERLACIGIERDARYLPLAAARMVRDDPFYRDAVGRPKPGRAPDPQGSLFDGAGA